MTDAAELLSQARRALSAADVFVEQARAAVAAKVGGSRPDPEALEREQFAAHALAWYATYAGALRQMLGWAERLQAGGRFAERERLILGAAFGEYLAQMAGGLAMSQGEIVRPADLGIEAAGAALAADAAVANLIREGNTDAVRRRLAALIGDGAFGDTNLGDEALHMARDHFHRFAENHREQA